MISWHRVGQKVARIDGLGRWRRVYPTLWQWLTSFHPSGPECGQVYTIAHVYHELDGIWFALREIPVPKVYAAKSFRPVYPTIIEQLRKLDAPSPERVKEEA